MNSKFLILLFACFLITYSCKNGDQKAAAPENHSYTEHFVSGSGVKIHYLEWKNEGPVLVMIAGLGDTPYLFEELADELSSHFHIIAPTRRGHGQSINRLTSFNNENLRADILMLLDSLHIGKVSLLGWSAGGNETTAFAARNPERVDKLIYFEAEYDMSEPNFKYLLNNILPIMKTSDSDLATLDAYRDWYHHFWYGDIEWNQVLENNLRASTQVAADGHVTPVPSNDLFGTFMKEAMRYHREYEIVQAPCLVITTKTFFHPQSNDPATMSQYDDLERNIISPVRSMNLDRMKNILKQVEFVEAPAGTHTSFIFSSKDFLVNAIDAFLIK
jgi:pimeloyl-ACP methyl ester carboxylesterase